MHPVMWAGIAMMTLVAGVLVYFGWWTKAAVAIGVGLEMIVTAQTLPDHAPASAAHLRTVREGEWNPTCKALCLRVLLPLRLRALPR